MTWMIRLYMCASSFAQASMVRIWVVPKTARSARSLDAPAFTTKALTEHRAMDW